MNREPKYKLGQTFAMVSMGAFFNDVEIIERNLKRDVDSSGKCIVTYDLRHNVNLPEALIWYSIPEDLLTEWIEEANGGNYMSKLKKLVLGGEMFG